MVKFLNSEEGHQIAYHQILGKSPGVVFLGGFMSDMSGTKASYLESFCKTIGQSYTRFDYLGHGLSSGHLVQGSIGRWKKDVLMVLDQVARGPQILVGSSMGGWLMLLAARERPTQVKGLVGIAAAPDFTSDLIYLSPEQKTELETKGVCYISVQAGKDPYPLTKEVLEEGKKHHVLNEKIHIECKVHLLHGMKDEAVPWQRSVQLSDCLVTNDVTITLIKEADHRLVRESDLEMLTKAISDFL